MSELRQVKKIVAERLSLREENEQLRTQLDALNQAYENASRIASERLGENQRRRDENIKLQAENERLKKTLSVYRNPDNWIEGSDCENIFSPDIPVTYPWDIKLTGG